MTTVKATKKQTKTRKKASSQNKTSQPDNVKSALIKAAKKMFAQRGLSGTTIRDIAQQARVNSSMISYYFQGKEGLYRECLREIGKTQLTFARQILRQPNSKDEFHVRLQLFAENLFTLFYEDRDAGLIIIREFDRAHSPASSTFQESFIELFGLIIDFFRQAQRKRIVLSRKDPFILASLYFGLVSSQMRLDHIKEKAFHRTIKDSKERDKLIATIVSLFEHQ